MGGGAQSVRAAFLGRFLLGLGFLDLAARRQAIADIGDEEAVRKLFSDIASKYTERQGGYTRILKLGPRRGDAAPMALLELV